MKKTKIVYLEDPAQYTILNTIENYEKEGYEVQNISSTSSYTGSYGAKYYLTIVFVKEIKENN